MRLPSDLWCFCKIYDELDSDRAVISCFSSSKRKVIVGPSSESAHVHSVLNGCSLLHIIHSADHRGEQESGARFPWQRHFLMAASSTVGLRVVSSPRVCMQTPQKYPRFASMFMSANLDLHRLPTNAPPALVLIRMCEAIFCDDVILT